MTTDADVRTWARDAGIAVPARGKVPDAVREAYAEAHPAADNPGLSVGETAPEHGYAEPELMPTRPGGAPAGHPEEVAPTPPPGGPFGRFKAKRTANLVRPKQERKRVSLESLVSTAWGVLGNAAASRGLVPTGRALALQAPIAGMILEDSLKGSAVDRLMQPIARSGEMAKEVGALLGVPVLVTVLTVKPQMAETLVPTLKSMLREWAIIAGPRMKARQKREEKALEQLGVDESGLDAMVDGWVEALFAMPEGEGAPDGT